MLNAFENVIHITLERRFRNSLPENKIYADAVNEMTKLELLEEMVTFHEEDRLRGSDRLDHFIKGRILFLALESRANTAELRTLASSYRRHLEIEIKHLITA